MALLIKGFGQPITINNPYLERFAQFGDKAGKAIQSGIDLGKESVKGGLNAFNPVQTYKDVKATVEPIAGEGGIQSQAMQQDTSTRNAQISTEIGRAFKEKRITKDQAIQMLGRLPQQDAQGNESYSKAFVNGATVGASAAGWADMANDVVNAVWPKDKVLEEASKTSAETSKLLQEQDNLSNQYRAQHNLPAIDHQHPAPLGDSGTAAHAGEAGLPAAEATREFPGPGATTKGELPLKAVTVKLPTLQPGQEYLTTNIIKKLEAQGKTSVGRQELFDLLRGQGVTKRELELITSATQEMGDTPKFDLKELKTRVQSKTLPLSSDIAGSGYDYINLKDGEVDPNAEYVETVYESPIKNSAGESHFSDVFDGYFAHVRSNIVDNGKTLDDIEIQSDLFKNDIKDSAGLDFKTPVPTKKLPSQEYVIFPKGDGGYQVEIVADLTEYKKATGLSDANIEMWDRDRDLVSVDTKLFNTEKELRDFVGPDISQQMDRRIKGVDALSGYKQNWFERIIRERLKYAAEQGMEKYRIPTGETALKIEGLGAQADVTHDAVTQWSIGVNGPYGSLTIDNLNDYVGKPIYDASGNKWFLYNPGVDGRFSAIPYNKETTPIIKKMDTSVEGITDREEAILAKYEEGFDIGQRHYTRDSASARLREIDQKVKEARDWLKENPYPGSDLMDERNAAKRRAYQDSIRPLESEKSTITIFMNYEARYSDYLKKLHPEMKRVTDQYGIDWWEVQVKPEDKGDVIAMKKAARTTA